MRGEFSIHDTLCWSCANACGGCSWSAELTPVPGWVAEETYIWAGSVDSYHVTECPEYKPDDREDRRPSDLDTEGCVQLLEKAMSVVRRDFILGGSQTKTEVRQFIRDWLPDRTGIIHDLEKAAKEWETEMERRRMANA